MRKKRRKLKTSVKKRRKLKASVKIGILIILTMTIIQVFNIIDNKFRIMADTNKIIVTIDMGHGGKDQGSSNQSGNIIEKEITLQIGEKVATELEKTGKIKVIKTRDSDEYIGLKDRTNISNDNNSNLFISIHCNSTPDKSYATNGVETYYWSNSDDNSYNLANKIQNSILSNLKVNDRGVKRENYQVLRESSCPSVLIETGFLSNPKEAYNLSKNKYQQKLAKSIANGIKEYLALND